MRRSVFFKCASSALLADEGEFVAARDNCSLSKAAYRNGAGFAWDEGEDVNGSTMPLEGTAPGGMFAAAMFAARDDQLRIRGEGNVV